jgi:hypothetical protein
MDGILDSIKMRRWVGSAVQTFLSTAAEGEEG